MDYQYPYDTGAVSDGSKFKMSSLLEEFRGLYEDRLARVPQESEEGADKARIQIYQSYVNDLCEQNVVLVQTVQQLESEANGKIHNLEQKLNKAAAIAKQSSKAANNSENLLAQALVERKKADNLVSDLQNRLQRMSDKYSEAHSKNKRLGTDVNKLIEVVTRARLQGEWDVTGVQFEELSNQAVFGLTTRSGPTKEQELQSKLMTKDRHTAELEQEVRRVKKEYDDFALQVWII